MDMQPTQIARRLLVAVLLVTFAGGCVYYNTFYNARRAFNEAEGQRKRSTGATPSVNTGQYNTAIEKSLKVIENHPNSRFYDDALFVVAVSYFWLKNYGKAERRFREILANYPNSKFIKDSELYLAKTMLEQRDVDEAMSVFESIFNRDYERLHKADAALGLGRYYFEDDDFDQANFYFMAIRDSLGDGPQKTIAQMYLADALFKRFQFGDALAAYLQVLGMDADKAQRYHALYRAALCSYRLQRIDDGLDYLQTLMDDELYFDSLGVLRLAVAQGYEYDDDLILAMNAYDRVAQEEQRNEIAAEAWFNLGLIYQYELDDLAKAKEAYDETAKLSRTSEIGQEALERSADIGKLEEYARTFELDSTATEEMIDEAAHTQYLLAELYWFKLNKPDSAIAEMQYMVDSFPSAYETPKGMIALAAMIKEHEGDTAGADSLLREVIAKHSNSDYVGEALELLGLKGTEVDTGYAEVYLRRAEYFVVDEPDPDSARYYYRYIADNFPDSKFWLQSQFGYIYVSEMYDPPGDSSLILAYSEIADSFPGTIWSGEARKRLAGPPKQGPPDQPSETQPEYAEVSPGEDTAAGLPYLGGPTTAGDLSEDTAGAYGDPDEDLYVGPNGEPIPLLPDNIKGVPRIPFEYPAEAVALGWEGEVVFQILLDFSGRVAEYIVKRPAWDEEIQRRVEETVGSMVFDPTQFPEEYQDTWLVYKYWVSKPVYRQ